MSELYVYAVIPAGPFRPRVRGIDGKELDVVTSRAAGVAAVVHAHDAPPYEGPDDEVKRWILEHSDVVEDAWNGAGAVLPVSFNVIVRPDDETGASAADQLRAWLESTGDGLARRLGELDGTAELRIEISLDREEHTRADPEIARQLEEMADRPAGVRRLMEKKLEKTSKERTDAAADELYPSWRSRIAAHCLEIEEYRAPVREASLVPVITAACLVRADATRALGEELAEIDDSHPAARIRFLGPWPPYSFADVGAPQ
ncbi:GvpL/GvpF family gas vesicle protein [Brachybacterium sp. GCM10030267]|uniref:GvpL/GvpF family gas vesicle protein n=1 Tax=Brachybacterium sp. GCM10030267 TaxID=3273381 RepID=UPI00360B672B